MSGKMKKKQIVIKHTSKTELQVHLLQTLWDLHIYAYEIHKVK